MNVALVAGVGVVALAAIITLSVLLIVSRRQLSQTRRELERSRQEHLTRRKRRLGVGPLAIKAAFQTADSLLKKGLGATVRNSIEDLAGWAQVERPDLARLTADGDVVIVVL